MLDSLCFSLCILTQWRRNVKKMVKFEHFFKSFCIFHDIPAAFPPTLGFTVLGLAASSL